jgi:MoxR-like ATPase
VIALPKGTIDLPLPLPTTQPAPVASSPQPIAPQLDKPSTQGPVGMGEMLEAMMREIARSTAGQLDEAKVINLIQTHAPKAPRQVIEIRQPTKAPVVIESAHPMLERALAWTSAGVHLAVVGPAGSGKTMLAMQVAKALGKPFFATGVLDSPYKLLGYNDSHGRYITTPFRQAFEQGGHFLLDEMDGSNPGVPLTINSALSNGFQDFPDGVIQMHPDFSCMVAANTYGRGADRVYVGRNQLDGATLDRFAFESVDYDEALEAQLCGNDAWHRRVVALRRGAEATKVRVVISMRASINGAKGLAAGIPQAAVENAIIWKGIDSDSRAKVEGAAR